MSPDSRPPVSGEPLPPCPICGKSDLFMGRDGKPGCPHCEVAVVLPPVSGEPTRFPGRRFHTALGGRVSWYCVPEARATPPDEGRDRLEAALRDITEYSWGLHLAGTPNEAEAIAIIEAGRAALGEQGSAE